MPFGSFTQDTTIHAVLLDISGSTEGQVLTKLIKQVKEECKYSSHIALITFHNKAKFHGTFTNLVDFDIALRSLQSKGSTCTDCGIDMLTSVCPVLYHVAGPFYNVLLATDGQMDRISQKKFPRAVQILSQKLQETQCSQLRFFLLTVEERSEVNLENMNAKDIAKSAGGDIMNVLVENGQKSLVARFTTYSPDWNHPGYLHFEFIIPEDPDNFLAYNAKTIFPVSKLSWFVSNFLYDQLVSVKNLPESQQHIELLHILQQTSWVLKMAKDHSQPLTCLNGICQLVHYLFPSWGSGEVYSLLWELMDVDVVYLATIKEKRRKLFENASKALKRNARLSTGMVFGVSLPCGFVGQEQIFVAPYVHVKESWSTHLTLGAASFDNVVLPMLPGVIERSFNTFEAQCARQACRIIATQFIEKMKKAQLHETSYILVPYYLLLNLRIAKSSKVSHNVKRMYQHLATNMLYMKRTNDLESSEMECLLRGQLLRPHQEEKCKSGGNVSSQLFLGNLLQSARYYADISHDLGLRPLTWWWAMIVALEEEDLLVSQWPNVCQSVASDLHVNAQEVCSDLSRFPLVETIESFESLETSYQYYCPITLEDTSTRGGFVLRPHGECFPNYVFQTAFPLKECGCPYCHMPLCPQRDYIPVPPKPILLEAKHNPIPTPLLPKRIVNLPPLSQLVWEANLIPILGQGPIVDVSYYSTIDPNQVILSLANSLGIIPDSFTLFLHQHPCTFVFGSVLLRVMKQLPLTDIDIAFIGEESHVLDAMMGLRCLLDSGNTKREYKHTSTGVFTGSPVPSNLLPPVQFVRANVKFGYQNAQDLIQNADNPISQCCLFSQENVLQLQASVHFLDFLQCNMVKWWNLSTPVRFGRALRYQEEYAFPFSSELKLEMENHPFRAKIQSREAPQALIVHFDDLNSEEIFKSCQLEAQLESWLEGVSKQAEQYPPKT